VADARQRLALIMAPGFVGDTMFPELGLYDCHSCHRSMKSVQWRRLPRQGGAGPGAPFINDSSFVMIAALARAIDPSRAEAIDAATTQLYVAGSGSPDELRGATQALDSLLSQMQSRLNESSFGSQERAILEEILRAGVAGNFLDYESAEQAFMAVQMLVFELHDDAMQAEVDALADILEDDERYRPAQFAQLLRAFEDVN
jgi:hypothetical protein